MNTIHQELQTRPTYVEIDLDTLRSNMRSIQSLSTSKIMWVVKANAYGHGAIEVAHCLQDAGADYLGVALPEEGAELREAGITIPILVLSAIADEQIHLCIKNDLTLTAPSDERVQRINEVADEMKTRARIHINVDTGMGRIGVHYSRVEKFFPAITKASSVDVEGIYSHFSSSEKNGKQTQIQLKRFLSVCRQFEEAGITFEIKHIANSAATVLNLDTHFDMVRVGLALYGFAEGYILPRGLPLKPVLSWKTQVSYFKSLSKGEGVGYGHSYIASEDTRIATLTVGYADGYRKAMDSSGSVIIRGRVYPIVGSICMDQMMIDLGSDGEAYVGDEVILIGKSNTHDINFSDIARVSKTSIYELLCGISYRVRRTYINSRR